MPRTVVIPHVSRIEGHAQITIDLDDRGEVSDARLHVTQLRGFEKFTEGRPFYEMPSITARICGICPISHSLASVKACEQIMAVRIPPAASKLRELIHYAQFVQSHALSFFHLSGPDLVLGMDAEPSSRNVLGLAERHPEVARDGIELRRFGQGIIQRLAGQRIHPTWIVPGGVSSPLTEEARDEIRGELPAALAIARRAIALLKRLLPGFSAEIASFSNLETLYAALVDKAGRLQIYDGGLSFRSSCGDVLTTLDDPSEYASAIAETTLSDSYMKAPFFRALGAESGVYRVGPLARLNVAEFCGTPEADAELTEFRTLFGRFPTSGFLYHYARLIESLWCLERIGTLLDDPALVDRHVRAHSGVNSAAGVGIIEAPRGTLIHHYRVNDGGAITWTNLIVATGHNTLAMNHGVKQVARQFVKNGEMEDGILNRVSAVVRAYDPCLSCATHAVGRPAIRVDLRDSDGVICRSLTTRDA